MKSDAELEQITKNVVFAASGIVPKAAAVPSPKRILQNQDGKSRTTPCVVISNHLNQAITNVPEDDPQEY